MTDLILYTLIALASALLVLGILHRTDVDLPPWLDFIGKFGWYVVAAIGGALAFRWLTGGESNGGKGRPSDGTAPPTSDGRPPQEQYTHEAADLEQTTQTEIDNPTEPTNEELADELHDLAQ